MRYLLDNDGLITYPFNLDVLRADTDISLSDAPNAASLAEFGVFPVAATDRPTLTAGQVAIEGAPELVGGAWRQTWTVATAPVVVPASVTPRQARLALLGAGLLATVESQIAALPQAAQIEWEFANTIDRGSGLISALGGALGLDDAAIDALFIAAATL